MTDKKKDVGKNVQSEIIIYKPEDGKTKIDVKFQDEKVWFNNDKLC